jgi:hypothetical protein
MDANATTAKDAKAAGLVLLHSCVANVLDPAPPSCRCRRWVTNDAAEDYLKQGRVVDWESCRPFFVGRAIVEAGRHKLTPRGAWIEKAHVLRGVESITVKSNNSFKSPEQIKTEYDILKKQIQEDRLDRSEDERHRWAVWYELQVECLKSITREIPAEEWSDLERIHLDVPLFSMACVDKRTRGGVGVNIGTEVDSIDEGQDIFDHDDATEDDEIESSEAENERADVCFQEVTTRFQ